MQKKDYFQARALLKDIMRDFFKQRSYLEVETPIAVIAPGTEVHLDYFKTSWQDHSNKSHEYYLRSSPEIHMKQVLATGVDRIYQFAPCFRNGGEHSQWHHPEFSMLEWYQSQISDEDFIKQTEQLLTESSQHFTELMKHKAPELKSFKKFERFSIKQAFKEFAKIDLIDQDPDLGKKARATGIKSPNADDDFETSFFKIILEKIEPALTQISAAILYDYPPSQAALAKKVDGVAKRFEFYIEGNEISNGFLELTDPDENEARLQDSNIQRKSNGKEEITIDQDFISSLQKGIPPCCGNALGFDRWLAILLGEDSLDRIIPFRNNKPYGQRVDG